MNNPTTLFIGLDTAKEHTEVAYSDEDRKHTPCPLGKIRSTKQGVEKLARQLQSKYPGVTWSSNFVHPVKPLSSFRKTAVHIYPG